MREITCFVRIKRDYRELCDWSITAKNITSNRKWNKGRWDDIVATAEYNWNEKSIAEIINHTQQIESPYIYVFFYTPPS